MKTTTTYVLFGKDAILKYKTSLDHLLQSQDLKYDVAAYTSVNTFVRDKNCWNDFTVISQRDYQKLMKHINAHRTSFQFIPYFDSSKKSFVFI